MSLQPLRAGGGLDEEKNGVSLRGRLRHRGERRVLIASLSWTRKPVTPCALTGESVAIVCTN
jgi:hypothetical protein